MKVRITKNDQTEAPKYDTKEWMTNLPAHLTKIPISRLQIPGSHDSGANLCLSSKLPVANDEKRLISFLGKSKYIRKGIKRWAVTQKLDIIDQLEAGIRYFDLRVSHPPDKVRQETGDFHLVHALYGPLLANVLTQIREFLDLYSGEVVLLDVNHLFGLTPEAEKILIELIGTLIGWNKICPPVNQKNCTLEFMRKNGYQVVIFFSTSCETVFWPQEAIFNPWPNVNRTNRLVSFLERSLYVDRPLIPTLFFVSQGVLTARLNDVVFSWRSTLEEQLSLKANEAIEEWLKLLPPKILSNINVIMTDFVHSDLSRSIIDLNYKVHGKIRCSL